MWGQKKCLPDKRRQWGHWIPSKPRTLDLIETLDLFFRRACYHRNAFYRKMKTIKVVEKLQIYKFGSVLFLVHDSSEAATELAKKASKFPWGLKLEGFTVDLDYLFQNKTQSPQKTTVMPGDELKVQLLSQGSKLSSYKTRLWNLSSSHICEIYTTNGMCLSLMET